MKKKRNWKAEAELLKHDYDIQIEKIQGLTREVAAAKTVAEKHRQDCIKAEDIADRRGMELKIMTDARDSLKRQLADSKEVQAYLRGQVDALENQIDAAAPKVEVAPARFASPKEVKAMRSGGSLENRAMARIEHDMAAIDYKPRRHWSEL